MSDISIVRKSSTDFSHEKKYTPEWGIFSLTRKCLGSNRRVKRRLEDEEEHLKDSPAEPTIFFNIKLRV